MRQIVTLREPTIIPNRITIADLENRDSGIKFSEYFGQDSPVIKVNGLVLYDAMIDRMQLQVGSFLPTIEVTIDNMDGLFSESNYPVDGDFISIYIKSRDPRYKSITMDFRITEVSQPISVDDRNYYTRFTLNGVLDIPMLFTDHYYSHLGNTVEALDSLCAELGLGLASNEPSTNDQMVRVCAYKNYSHFIQDLVLSAYKDDNTFFTCYVDQYYYLNFVELNGLFTHDMELEDVSYIETMVTDYRPDDKNKPSTPGKFFISNSKATFGTPYQISGFAINNRSGNISMVDGYRRYLKYYNKDAGTFEEYYIEPMVTDGAGDKSTGTGRPDEDSSKQARHTYRNYQFNSNVHPNYYHAIEQNYLNNRHCRKISLSVNLKEVNPAMHLGKILPAYIVKKDLQGESSTEQLDEFASGFYVIDGISYIYNKPTGQYNMRLLLIKREW